MYNQQQPGYQPNYAVPAHVDPESRSTNWQLIGAYIMAAVGAGVAIACLLLFLGYKSTVATEMTQVSHAIQEEQTAQSKSASSISSLNQKFDGMTGVVDAITGYNMTCSQYLTGPGGGPTTFYLPCTDVKPGS